MKMLFKILLFLFSSYSFGNQKFDHNHSEWTKILKKNIQWNESKTSTTFNYKNVNLKTLDRYIDFLLKVSEKKVNSWSNENQFAYYLNLYNSLTIKLIKSSKKKIKSIRELGSFLTNPWKKKFFVLFGKKSNLDHIEHTIVRESGKFKDYRLHFGFNCASIGCPALLDEAFIGKKLNKQLNFAEKTFLSDRTRNFYDPNKNTVFLSKIFDWYKGDFEKGWLGVNSLKDYVLKVQKHITQKKLPENIKIEFLKYNWNLNNLKL